MKREAVQEERQKAKDKSNEDQVESSTSVNSDMPLEKILNAQLAVEPINETYIDAPENAIQNICQAADHQLVSLVDWAKRIPHFTDLDLKDQVIKIP